MVCQSTRLWLAALDSLLNTITYIRHTFELYMFFVLDSGSKKVAVEEARRFFMFFLVSQLEVALDDGEHGAT